MKKIIYLIICLFVVSKIVFAEDDMYNKGLLFINNKEVYTDTVMYNELEMYIPLRSVFELLGGEVIWNKDTGDINIKYLNEEYTCQIVELDPMFPQRLLRIRNVNKINLRDNNSYIQLNPMCADGAFEMINDRTYLYEEAGKRLFEAMGCSVEIDKENHIVRISN